MLFFNKEQAKEISRLKWQVSHLTKKVSHLQKEISHNKLLALTQLLRVKNQESLSDDYILNSNSYLDLSPEKAFEIYNDLDKDYVLLDVSHEDFHPPKELPEAVQIPLEDLDENLYKLSGPAKNYIIISEEGVRSILACKILNEAGFYNLSNISGGYSYWPGFGSQSIYDHENSAA